MLTQWTSNCRSAEDKQKFQDMVHASSKVLERLKEILQHQMQGLERPTEADFDSPAWAQKMAFILGQQKVLAATIQLLTIN